MDSRSVKHNFAVLIEEDRQWDTILAERSRYGSIVVKILPSEPMSSKKFYRVLHIDLFVLVDRKDRQTSLHRRFVQLAKFGHR